MVSICAMYCALDCSVGPLLHKESMLARRATFSLISPAVRPFPHFLSPCWGPPRRQG